MDYNLLKSFIKVSELGSFTKAAKILNQPKSRVSRAIARLENELGIQLIRRTTRRSSLTTIGKEFYNNIYPLLNKIDGELTKVNRYQQEMSGIIRITAPQDIAQTLLSQIISTFTSIYPDIEIQTIITNDFLDLTKENIDLSIRAGKLQDSTLIQKKLMSVNFIIVCTTAYLEKYGRPVEFKDLENHKFLSFKNMEKSCFEQNININPIIKSDSIPMLLSMALADTGIAILPDYFCQAYLGEGSLIRLFTTWKSEAENIHILYHPNKNTQKKIKKFVQIAIKHFNKEI